MSAIARPAQSGRERACKWSCVWSKTIARHSLNCCVAVGFQELGETGVRERGRGQVSGQEGSVDFSFFPGVIILLRGVNSNEPCHQCNQWDQGTDTAPPISQKCGTAGIRNDRRSLQRHQFATCNSLHASRAQSLADIVRQIKISCGQPPRDMAAESVLMTGLGCIDP